MGFDTDFSNKKKIIIIVAAIILVVGVIAGIFLFKESSKPEKIDEPINTEINIDETKDQINKINYKKFKAKLVEKFIESKWNIVETRSKSIETVIEADLNTENSENNNEVEITSREDLSNREYNLTKQYNYEIKPIDNKYYDDESLKISASISSVNGNNYPNSMIISIAYNDEESLNQVIDNCYDIFGDLLGGDVRAKLVSLNESIYEETTVEIDGKTLHISKSLSDLGYEQGHKQYTLSVNYVEPVEAISNLKDYFETSNEDTMLSKLAIYNNGDSIKTIENRLANLFDLNAATKIRYLYEDNYIHAGNEYSQLTAVLDSRIPTGETYNIEISLIEKNNQHEYLKFKLDYSNDSRFTILYKVETFIEKIFGYDVKLDGFIKSTDNIEVNIEDSSKIDTKNNIGFGFPAALSIKFLDDSMKTAEITIESIDKEALNFDVEETYYQTHNVDKDGNVLTENGNISISEDEINPFQHSKPNG